MLSEQIANEQKTDEKKIRNDFDLFYGLDTSGPENENIFWS